MINTTLCYIEKDQCYLMLFRNKKPDDPNEGKWVGVGGKFEEGETPDQCLLREVWEETGVQLTDYVYRGLVHFVSDIWEDEEMYLYSGYDYDGEISSVCSEGELSWIKISEVCSLNLWEGDKCFLELMAAGEKDFELTLRYEGDTLVSKERIK
ncbi:MAG: 8-oxo-dGTP diphosphatase [Clostridiales bacterium]|nr:8-oxo-dGTP diphosphatase [Candidatus Crickella merdequi]